VRDSELKHQTGEALTVENLMKQDIGLAIPFRAR
jgi:hypothetical protein